MNTKTFNSRETRVLLYQESSEHLISKVGRTEIFWADNVLGLKLWNFKSDGGKTQRMIKGISEQKSF